MNEEINVLSSSDTDLPASNPLPPSEETPENAQTACEEEKCDDSDTTEGSQNEEAEENTNVSTDSEDLCLPTTPLPASDPDSGASPASDTADRLDRLQAELKSLRDQLTLQRNLFERIDRERNEFKALYPDTPLDTLPDSVWKEVENGIPLAAAFALSERRKTVANLLARESNLANSTRTVGGVRSEENEYFSSDEVRAMSREEIHKNYSKIMESMKRWN